MYTIVTSSKSFDQATADLEAAVKRHSFGVLHVHDMGAILRGKGFAFESQVKIFEVCNPALASQMLAADLHINLALPCRISVFTEAGQTKIGLLLPQFLLSGITQEPALQQAAKDVEAQLLQMVEEAR